MLNNLNQFSPVKASDLNEVINYVNQATSLTVEPPLEMSSIGAQRQLRMTTAGFFATITGGGSPYSWAAVQMTELGTWGIITGGKTGHENAYEWNQNDDIAPDTIVWMEPGLIGSQEEWRFQADFPNLGCYLKRGTDPDTGLPNVTLDLEKIIQPDEDTGLKVVETTYPEDPTAPKCNWISINTGCGTEIIDGTNELSVRLEDLIRTDGDNSCGTTSGLKKCIASGCSFLYVGTSCGVEIDNSTNTVRVKLEDLIRTTSFNSCGTASGLAVCSPGEGCKFLYVNPGCGIRVDSTNKVRVWLPDMVGYGLEIDEEEPCQFNVYPGCGITIDELGRTAVKLSELVSSSGANSCGVSSAIGICEPTPSGCPFLFVKTGCGIRTVGDRLVWYPIDVVDTTRGLEIRTSEGCSQIAINYGCGLHLVDGQLQFYANQAAGDGLRAQDECSIQIFPGCGIYVDSEGRTAVKVSELIRTDADNSCGRASGLAVCAATSGCPFLYVNAGCGLTVDSATNKLKVKLDDIAGAGLEVNVPEEGCPQLKLANPVSFTFLQGPITATCNEDGTITVSATEKTFTGYGVVS